jgi:hypothetical protein
LRFSQEYLTRENYAIADQPGVVIVFEVDSVAEARRYLDEFPMTKAGLLEWTCIPVTAPLPLEAMFDAASLQRVAMPDSQLEGASA